MRSVHFRVLAIAGVLTVVVGVAAAVLVGRDAVPAPAAAATPTTLTTPAGQEPAAGNDPAPTDTTTTRGPRPATVEQAAKAAAIGFMRELGMRDPVAASYRATGSATAAVGVHPRTGEEGRALDRVTTLVQLRRYANGWVVTGAKAVNAIEVDEPLPFTRIQSPVTVSGLSVAYEGTVQVTVTEDRRGADRVLGRGFVNGGASELGPFGGRIPFTRPSGDAGWVIFSGDSGLDAGIFSATAVRVRFVNGDHPAQILDVTTSPAPVGSSRLITLTGSGTLAVRVKAFGADEVRVLLVPSGTGGLPHARLLGVDHRSEGGERWSVSWRYPDEPLHGHLLIQANGRGGSAQHGGIAILHN
jgi:hypothetical protein